MTKFSFRRLNAIIVKEFIHIIRDWRSLTLAITIPILLLALFGYALNIDLKNAPISIIDKSNTPESRELISMFDGSPYFSIHSYLQSNEQLEDTIKRREVKAGLYIQSDFAKRLNNNSLVQVNLTIDGSDANTGRLIQNYTQALASIYNHKIAVSSHKVGALRVKPRAWYNQELTSTFNLVPGITAIVMVVIASMLASVTVAKEWEMGTMEQLISTPIMRLELTLGKAIPLYIIGLVDVLIATIIGMAIFFNVPLRGEPALVIFTATVFLTGVLFFGLVLSIVLKKAGTCQSDSSNCRIPANIDIERFRFHHRQYAAPYQDTHTRLPCEVFHRNAEKHISKRCRTGYDNYEFHIPQYLCTHHGDYSQQKNLS